MKKEILLVLAMLFSPGLMIAFNDAIEFKTDLNVAKKQASSAGKLCIVAFVTDHCYPCKMMDESTFTNQHVVSYIEENYIPVKINVESFDGFVWKEKYGIHVVPTIIIFNSQGETIAKYEESMGSQRMYNILRKHNNNQTGIAPTTPASTTAPTTSVEPPPSDIPPSIPMPSANNIENNATGLVKVKRAARSGYGVQVGVYAQYGNVLHAVEGLERRFSGQMLVNIHTLGEQTVYKVIVGGFPSQSDANDFKRQISREYPDCFVVDLSKIEE